MQKQSLDSALSGFISYLTTELTVMEKILHISVPIIYRAIDGNTDFCARHSL